MSGSAAPAKEDSTVTSIKIVVAVYMNQLVLPPTAQTVVAAKTTGGKPISLV